jgi:uncharacterized protein (DUF427 family)
MCSGNRGGNAPTDFSDPKIQAATHRAYQGQWVGDNGSTESGQKCARTVLLIDDSLEGLSHTVRFVWDALGAWHEEDEQVFVHPHNPYVRVDALRSTCTARIELGHQIIAQSSSPVMDLETGLPTRYYLNATEVNFHNLIPSATDSSCPYKGTTSRYWSIRTDNKIHDDLVWAYDYPTPQIGGHGRANRLQRTGWTFSLTDIKWRDRQRISSTRQQYGEANLLHPSLAHSRHLDRQFGPVCPE